MGVNVQKGAKEKKYSESAVGLKELACVGNLLIPSHPTSVFAQTVIQGLCSCTALKEMSEIRGQ